MEKDLKTFKTALNNLFDWYGVDTYMLSFEKDGEWQQMMRAPKKDK